MTRGKKKKSYRYSVPMIVNGHELPDVKSERVTFGTDRFIVDYVTPRRVDLSVPYQRSPVWTKQQKRSFIQSWFNCGENNRGMAIPPIYLCKKKTGKTFSPVDGLQRIETLGEFISGKFSDGTPFKIRIRRIDEETGKVSFVKATWQDILEKDEFFELRQAFYCRDLEGVIFEYMPLDDQRKIFVALNNGEPLNVDEVTYCANYLVRPVLGQLFERIFLSDKKVTDEDCGPGLASVLQKNVRQQLRFRHLRTMQEVLILVTGFSGVPGTTENGEQMVKYVTGDPHPRGARQTERRHSARAVHELLASHGFDFDDEVDDNIIELLGLTGVAEKLQAIADELAVIFTVETPLGRAMNQEHPSKFILPRNVIDPLCFLYTICEQGHFSLTKIRKNRTKLANWLYKYYDQKAAADYNMATSDPHTMVGKFNLMARGDGKDRNSGFNKIFKTKIEKWKTAVKTKVIA